MWPPKVLKKLYQEYGEDPTPLNQCVEFVFHTYYGFLLFTIQQRHRFRLPPARARELLWELHKFNLTWGLFANGVLFIPLLSCMEYIGQKSRIKKQESRLAQGLPAIFDKAVIFKEEPQT